MADRLDRRYLDTEIEMKQLSMQIDSLRELKREASDEQKAQIETNLSKIRKLGEERYAIVLEMSKLKKRKM